MTRTMACSWIAPLTDPDELRRIVNRVVYDLSRQDVTFDAIAVQGLSGQLLGPTVALRMRKHLIVVRKLGEDRHSTNEVEGACGRIHYVILDDLIDSGSTIKRIQKTLSNDRDRRESRCVGVYFWQSPPLAYGKGDEAKYGWPSRMDVSVTRLPILNDFARDDRRGLVYW